MALDNSSPLCYLVSMLNNSHPLAHRFAILGLRLCPATRSRWFVGLPAPYVGILHQRGAPFAETRHVLQIIHAPILEDTKNVTIEELTSKAAKHPSTSTNYLTPPAVFHSKESILKAIQITLQTNFSEPEN